jgi:hypothetical protein
MLDSSGCLFKERGLFVPRVNWTKFYFVYRLPMFGWLKAHKSVV